MARTQSSKKRNRQNIKLRATNRARKGALKARVRKLTDSLTGKDAAACESEFKKLTKVLDHMAAKRTIHKNQAARRKSRLQKRLNALKSTG